MPDPKFVPEFAGLRSGPSRARTRWDFTAASAFQIFSQTNGAMPESCVPAWWDPCVNGPGHSLHAHCGRMDFHEVPIRRSRGLNAVLRHYPRR